jgi:hypothetical protein
MIDDKEEEKKSKFVREPVRTVFNLPDLEMDLNEESSLSISITDEREDKPMILDTIEDSIIH